MEEKPFEFNGIPVTTPNTFIPAMATTSTEDSDRTQDLVMHNDPMGTVESYSIGWENIDPKEAAFIISQIKNKKQYSLRHMNAAIGDWAVKQFYTANYTFGTLKTVNDKFVWESLSFNATGIYPV